MSLSILEAPVPQPTESAAAASRTVRRRGPRRSLVSLAVALTIAVHGSEWNAVFGEQTDPAASSKATTRMDAAKTGRDADAILRQLLPPRSDTPDDWHASVECLHAPGEPRALKPCLPPPPCDPSQPAHPYDLVGVQGQPTCGPIYRGPCDPRSGRRHHGGFAWCHHVCDRMFDHFYRSK